MKSFVDWGLGVAAVSLILLTAITWLSVIAPSSGASLAAARVLPLAEPWAAAAEQAFQQHDLSAALQDSRWELNRAPLRASGWLRLAQIDVARRQALSAAGLAALEHAYDSVPYDLNPASMRLQFALEHYDALTPSLRTSLSDEIDAWSASPLLKGRLISLAAKTQAHAAHAALETSLSGSAVQ